TYVVNPPQRFVMHFRIRAVALVLVIPVNGIYRPARTVAEGQPLRPCIIGEQKILPVTTYITGAFPLNNVSVDPVAVDIIHPERMPVQPPAFGAHVEHGSGMRVPSACRPRPIITCMRPVIPHPMHMIPMRFDILIDVRTEMLSGLPLKPRSLDHME